jgi:hypothetical protein
MKSILIVRLTVAMILIIAATAFASAQSASADTQEIGREGGALTVQTDDYFVTVDIPAGAVLEKTTLTLTVKPVTKWGPFSRNMLRGISIQPSGVLFYEPVRISACSYSDYELTENDGIFLLETNLLAIPCGENDLSLDEGMIAAATYQSGNFVVSSPSFEEVKQQVSRLIEYAGVQANDLPGTVSQQGHGPCPAVNLSEEDDCMGWQYTKKVVTGMLDYCERAILAGKTYEEEIWRQEISDFARKAINEFMNKPVADDPCGLYLHAAMKYREMEIVLGISITDGEDKSLLDKRLTSLLDQCMFRFTLETREWLNREEKRDDGSRVDEELNRHGIYYFNVPLFNAYKVEGTELVVRGSGSESIYYNKSFVLDNKERNETRSGERRVTDVKGGLYLKSHGPKYDTLEAKVSLYYQHDIRSRAWGKGFGSTGSYDNSTTDNSKSKETMEFVLGNYEKKFGDEKGGSSIKVTFTPPPSGSDAPRECW